MEIDKNLISLVSEDSCERLILVKIESFVGDLNFSEIEEFVGELKWLEIEVLEIKVFLGDLISSRENN